MAFKTLVKNIFHVKTIRINQFLNLTRYKSDGPKVALINSFDTIGISTAYLLKKTNLFSEICLQEFKIANNIKGVVADLNNINTPSVVTYKLGKFSLEGALKDADIVVILEKSAKPKKTKAKKPRPEDKNKSKCFLESAAYISNQVFLENADLCANIAELYAKVCPSALLAVTVKPINSTVPLICRVASQTNHTVRVQKILGFMSLDVTTATLLFAKKTKMKISSIKIPVVGGTSADTIVPLFSQTAVPDKTKEIPQDDLKKLTEEVRKSNESHLVNSKAPLATAAAISKFVMSLANIIKGDEMKECVFIASDLLPGTTYLGGIAQLGPAGVQHMLPFPDMSEYEKLLVESSAFYLKSDVKRGEDYAEAFLRNECSIP